MIGYINLGTNNFDKAAEFYDQLLAELNAKRVMTTEHFVAWANQPDAPMLSIIKPFDGEPATVGNGVMVALAAGSREAVDRLHAKALSLGATDEGAPGERMTGFYGGYFRDLDGHKLNFFHMG